MICDAHVHFFSPGFFDALGAQKGLPPEDRVGDVAQALEWERTPSVAALADRWVAELDAHGVSRAALIASLPGDEASVAARRRRPSRPLRRLLHARPDRDPTPSTASPGPRPTACAASACSRRCTAIRCGSPDVAAVFDLAAAHPGTAVFVHCGVLSVGARKKLGLPSPFEMRSATRSTCRAWRWRIRACRSIVPHFGAGMFREALMLADACPNVHLDTSSSNAWMRYTPGLTLAEVFRTALDVAGPGAAAVRHRLVVLPARLAGRRAGDASRGARRRRGDARAVAAGAGQQLLAAVPGAGAERRGIIERSRSDSGQHSSGTSGRRKGRHRVLGRARHQRGAALDARQGRDPVRLHGQPRASPTRPTTTTSRRRRWPTAPRRRG